MASISVIMPCYNSRKFIKEAIDSVIAQTYCDWELIIVEDASNLSSKDIVESYVKGGDFRIKYLVHPLNSGVSASRNTGLKAAKGDFIAFLDSDDTWRPDHLETGLMRMKQDECDLFCAAALQFEDTTGREMRVIDVNPEYINRLPESLYERCRIQPSGVIIRRKVYDKLNGFDTSPELQHVEDWDYWLRAYDAGLKFCFERKIGVDYRFHESCATSKKLMMAERKLNLLIKHRRLNGLSSTVVCNTIFKQSTTCGRLLRKSGKREAIGCFWHAVCMKPWALKAWGRLGLSLVIFTKGTQK